jgi:predicted RNA binding protein YcfA (HicA-like mRNA interferase family)
MVNYDNLLIKILRGISDNNITFNNLRKLLKRLGFIERIKGSHHIFYQNGIEEIINIQPVKNNAKAYQVKQVRNIILKYRLGGL